MSESLNHHEYCRYIRQHRSHQAGIAWDCCCDYLRKYDEWRIRSSQPQELRELSVTAVSELIQNTAREEEDLIIPVELVLMLARAICKTFGRPEQQLKEKK